MTHLIDDTTDIERIEAKVDKLSSDVRDLIDAWNAAKGLVRLVKFIAMLAVAYTAVWSALKMGNR